MYRLLRGTRWFSNLTAERTAVAAAVAKPSLKDDLAYQRVQLDEELKGSLMSKKVDRLTRVDMLKYIEEIEWRLERIEDKIAKIENNSR